MAHDITTINGKASMAFTGATPWHGLGQRLTEGAPLEVWREQAGFDWSALSSPVRFVDTAGETHVMPDRQVIYRSDTGAPLSVMGDSYKIVQPGEVIEFFRDLSESGGWHLHTAGVLRGGRKMWALARNHTEGEVAPGDKVRGNLLIATSLDGSMPTVAAMTAVRVVCANTLKIALSGAFEQRGSHLGKVKDGERAMKVSHRSQFDADACKRELGVARTAFEDFMGAARIMAAQSIELDEARAILRRVFGQPTTGKREAAPLSGSIAPAVSIDGAGLLSSLLAKSPTGQVREQRSVARCLALFGGEGRGANAEGSAGTRWGLFNAVTEHVDHEMGRSADTRLDSAWFGRGHEFKSQVLELLTK